MNNMLGDALAEVAGPLKDFAEKLGSPEGPSWLGAFKRFLRKEEPWLRFLTWKTVTIGTHKTVNKLRAALTISGGRISDWASDILNKITLASQKTTLDLVRITVAELGFKDGAYYKDICAKAKELGLELCPAEVGPQLRLQYADQPMGEWLVVAMESVTDSGGDLSVFDVGCDGDGLWLYSYGGRPSRFWDGYNCFVFVHRK